MLSKQNKFILALGVQLAIIVAIIIFKFSILVGGSAIYLRIAPVDPKDPLRGDYVTFQYSDISQISLYNSSDRNIKENDTVYVTLRESGSVWRYSTMSKTKPSAGTVFLKGKVSSVAANNSGWSSSATVKYGIEEYFIPEGTGRNFRFTSNSNVAKVKIDKDGNAVLEQIYVDGKEWP